MLVRFVRMTFQADKTEEFQEILTPRKIRLEPCGVVNTLN